MAMINEPVARYFPLESGQYAIKPGFYRLGHDFGNAQADTRLCQLDRQFAQYRQAKLAARDENPGKYICQDGEGKALEPLLNRFLLERLSSEYPDWFELTRRESSLTLHCRASGEKLVFDKEGTYRTASDPDETLTYRGGLDALAMQIQEDIALVRVEQQVNRLCAIHLCQPNHWDPREKIGRDFIAIHAPVPGMEKINPRANQLLGACRDQGPYVRFAWGLATDTRLNHHPEPPPGVDPQQWHGRAFEPGTPAAWLRVERQCLWGLPAADAVVFTIRTYHYPVAQLSAEQLRCLYQAIAGMDRTVLDYKGLADSREELLEWLRELSQDVDSPA